MLHHLIMNPEMMAKIQEDIDKNLVQPYLKEHTNLEFGETLTYESIFDLEYLPLVFKETLRRYPVVQTCSFFEIQTRGTFGSLKLEKGDAFTIDIEALHTNPE